MSTGDTRNTTNGVGRIWATMPTLPWPVVAGTAGGTRASAEVTQQSAGAVGVAGAVGAFAGCAAGADGMPAMLWQSASVAAGFTPSVAVQGTTPVATIAATRQLAANRIDIIISIEAVIGAVAPS